MASLDHASTAHRRSALRGLVWTLVRTDFKIRYHGTIGGFAWALAKPVSMFLVLLGIFSFIFGGDQDYALDLITGLFLYDFFSEGTRAGLGSLHGKGFLISKAKFPSWIVIATSPSNAVISASVFATTLILFVSIVHQAPSPTQLAAFGLYAVCFLAQVVGFSLATSVLFLRFRDLDQVWDLAVQAGFFVAPIIYPLRILPENLHIVLYLWPPTSIIEFSRQVLIEGTMPTTKAHLLLLAMTSLVVIAGTLVYHRLGPRSPEYL